MKINKCKCINVDAFKVKEVSGVTFGGFGLSPCMATNNKKLPYRCITLPQAMIAAANKGKGWHLLTAFEWASMAYAWQKEKNPEMLGFDMHAETWQWVMGLFMWKDGHVDVLGSLDVSYNGSPYGRGTIKRSRDITIMVVNGAGSNWLKKWDKDAFAGMKVYIAEANEFYPIAGNSKTSLTFDISSLPTPQNGQATFVIVRHIPIDVTTGMGSGDRIISLRESDPDLKPFAIPEKTNSLGAPKYGNDRYWFFKTEEMRAAFRGGVFDNGAYAGVFALYLNYAPSFSYFTVGFRAGKAL